MQECSHSFCPPLLGKFRREIVPADLHGVVRCVNLLWHISVLQNSSSAEYRQEI